MKTCGGCGKQLFGPIGRRGIPSCSNRCAKRISRTRKKHGENVRLTAENAATPEQVAAALNPFAEHSEWRMYVMFDGTVIFGCELQGNTLAAITSTRYNEES